MLSEKIVPLNSKLLTVTTTGSDVCVHAPVVTVTVYVPLAVITTELEMSVNGLVDHEYAFAPAGTDNVTEPPAQNVVGPFATIVEVAGWLTVTEAVAEHPDASETVTV